MEVAEDDVADEEEDLRREASCMRNSDRKRRSTNGPRGPWMVE